MSMQEACAITDIARRRPIFRTEGRSTSDPLRRLYVQSIVQKDDDMLRTDTYCDSRHRVPIQTKDRQTFLIWKRCLVDSQRDTADAALQREESYLENP